MALACSDPPEGREHWSMQMLADRLVQLGLVETISDETVRRVLKKDKTKPWLCEQWCIPRVDAQYVWKMEDVLDLYAESPDPLRPLVTFDHRPVQLLSDVREPLPCRPEQPRREYWRHVDVTERRTAMHFAHETKWLVDCRYPEAEVIRVVLDNVNIHSPASPYQAFPPEEARRLTKKLEFHHTPKHASWLNMNELELAVLPRECLNRRPALHHRPCAHPAHSPLSGVRCILTVVLH